jgi:O-antigen/teichoic acid export membrane protein
VVLVHSGSRAKTFASGSGALAAACEVLRESTAQVCGGDGAGTLRARVLSGSMIMLLSSAMVGAMNLVYNLAIAHGLGAAGFGHASAVYTVLMLLSSVTLSFQLLCSKFVAQNDLMPARVGIYRFLHRRAWLYGAAISVVLILSSPIVSSYLNLPTRNYIVLLGAGILFFIPLGVRRGLMQGMYDFPHLATNFVLEVIVKLGGALLLIDLGLGVTGVIVAVVASIWMAYLVARPGQELRIDSPSRVPATLEEGVQAIVFFVGQVIINNLDIVLVKHFFSATEAGVYATVALVGRVVYMLSWSVVSSMFPFSAGVRSRERDGRAVLSTALLLVVLITSVFTLAVWLAPPRMWHVVLGSGFPLGRQVAYSSLLVLYAATTGIYSLGVVLMSYEISRKIGNVSWLQLGFSGAIILGIYVFHNTLQEVITVQLVVMMLLLVSVSIPFLRSQSRAETAAQITLPASGVGVTKIRRVEEDEAILEFLKGEFYQPEFDHYREQFQDIVNYPDLDNARENTIRRALLFVRRGRLWRELPPDTEWWEIELQSSDISRIRVFPRNQWRGLAEGNFYLAAMLGRIRERVKSDESDNFALKLRSLSSSLAKGDDHSAVLLIGIDENSPLTIIEGNHRMAAASLVSALEIHHRFHFLCGFSPRMTECCWYQTDLSTLWRYARNYWTHLFEDQDLVIANAMSANLDCPGPQAPRVDAA